MDIYQVQYTRCSGHKWYPFGMKLFVVFETRFVSLRTKKHLDWTLKQQDRRGRLRGWHLLRKDPTRHTNYSRRNTWPVRDVHVVG